jgi:ABC-type sugar transport system permease subunit
VSESTATATLPEVVGHGRKPSRSRDLIGWVFILPLMLGIVAFQLVPIVVSIGASFTNWDGLTAPEFTGIENYAGLAEDPLFWTTLRNTLLFTVGVIPLTTVGALCLALLCRGRSRVANVVFRTAYFTPYVTSIVAIGLVWGKLLAPDGFLMIILLGGLDSIDTALHDAAKVDGASASRRLFSITLPLLTPQLFFVLITQFITSFQVFALIFVLTKGGPGQATNVYIYYLYQSAFTFGDLGTASAMAWILFIIIGAVTFLQLRLQKRWVFYG